MLCLSVLVVALSLGMCYPEPQQSVCPSQHSCFFHDSNGGESPGCSCHADCRKYGDCCYDSQYYDEAEQTKNVNDYVCPSWYEYYTKGKCLEGWDNTDVQRLCLMNTTPNSDYKSFPVYSAASGIHYTNHYCALCNGENPTFLEMELGRLECRTKPTPNAIPAFREGRWGVYEPSLGPSSFTSCPFRFHGEANHGTSRRCVPTVNTCSDPDADQRDRILCQSYTAIVYNESIAFRNLHCASCNGYKEYACDRFPPFVPVVNYFLMMLDFKGSCGGKLVGVQEPYDWKLGRCAELICVQPNTKPKNGKCVPN